VAYEESGTYLINLASGNIIVPAQFYIHESFVVTKVKINLTAVVKHIDLPCQKIKYKQNAHKKKNIKQYAETNL
jgi:hypothetical protein